MIKTGAEQWQDRLQTLREKSIADINFSDALDVVITREEYRTLSDDQQRELIQAWLYPTNDNGEIETRSDDEIRDELRNDDSIAEEKHYAEMSKFFYENVIDIAFSPYLPFCSKCGKPKPDYLGMMKFSDITLMRITFAFCTPCHDELQALKIERMQSPERLGV